MAPLRAGRAEHVASALHDAGYFGPFGIDVGPFGISIGSLGFGEGKFLISFGALGLGDGQFGYTNPGWTIEAIERMDIPEADKKKIFEDNARQLMRLPV